MNRHLLSTIALLLNYLTLSAQRLEESYFTPLPDLKENMVYCITQDKTGYIWVGTDAGVIRYDGHKSKLFTTEDGLGDNEVMEIKEDDKGRLWFLTYNGRLTYYNGGQIYTAAQRPFLEYVTAGSISVGWHQQGDTIWYTTRRKAYMFVNERYVKEWDAQTLFPHAQIGFSEVSIEEGPFRLLSYQGIYNPLTGQYHQFPSTQKVLPINKVVLFSNDLYYHTDTEIYHYNLKTRKYQTYRLPDGERIRAWYYRSKEKTFLLASQKFLYQFDTKTGNIQQVRSLPTSHASYLFEDREQNIWLGSFHQGVWIQRNQPGHLFNPQTQLGTQQAYSVGFAKGVVYAGYTNGEYFQWRNGNANWRHSSIPAGQHRSYGFTELDGQLYSLSGQQLINVENGKTILFPGSLKALAVKADTAYIALSFSVSAVPLHILLGDPADAAIQINNKRPIYDKRAYCLLVDADTLWLGSEEGISYYTGEENAKLLAGMPQAMRRKINRLHRTATGQLIAATAGGGIIFRDNAAWRSITTAQGLSSNNCNSLFVVGDSILWVGTDKGISKLHLRGAPAQWHRSLENFSAPNGLPVEYINDLLVNKDTLWMATPQGVAYICQSMLKPAGSVPVTIEAVTVNGALADLSTPLVLPQGQGNLRVDFTILAFGHPARRNFAYRLNGAEDQWNFTNARELQFSNLAAGEYTLLLTAGNPLRPETPITTLQFRILPPFWQQPLFIALALLLATGTAIGLVWWRLQSIHRKNELQRRTLELMKEKAELEQMAAAMQMNPHFLFNALNTIKGYYNSGNRKQGDQYTSKLAALMRLMLEQNTRGFITLSEEMEMLERYLELMCEQRSRKFGFTIETDIFVPPGQIILPPLLIQPFVENALLHGIAPLAGGGHIRVLFTLKNEAEMLTVEVLDNGVGLQKSVALQKLKMQAAKGITITKKRLQLMSNQSRLTVEETLNETGAVAGTRVLMQFPITLKTNDDAYDNC